MANHCYNFVDITGDANELKNLAEYLNQFISDDNGFEMGKIKPDSNDYYQDFGTRWWDLYLQQEDDNIYLSGGSAWSPPLQLLVLLSEKFPNLNFEADYEESGCDFGGWAEIKNGNMTDNYFSYYEYKSIRDYDDFLVQSKDNIEIFIDDGLTKNEILEDDLFLYLTDEDKKETIKFIDETLKKLTHENI